MKKILILVFVFCLIVPNVAARWSGTTPNLEITYSYEPFPAEPSNYFTVYIYAINTGASIEENIWFKLDAKYPFSLEEDTLYRGKISSQQKITLKYDVWVDADAREEDYTNRLTLKQCYDPSCTLSSDKDIKISVRNLQPILEISDIFIEEAISAGDIANVGISLKNKGGSRLKDVSVNLDLSLKDLPLVPFGDSSEKIIHTIEKSSEAQVNFNILAYGNANSGTYKIPLFISYYDDSGNNYFKEDILGLVIGGHPFLKVGLERSDYLSSGNIGEIVLNIINYGPNNAKFLNLEILPTQEFEVISREEIYLGNLNSDGYETANFKLKIYNTDQKYISLPVRLTYADVNNNRFNEDYEVELRLFSSSELSKLREQNSYLPLILGLLLLAGGFFAYKKYLKRENK